MTSTRFTYANVASTLALVVALGGGGVAVAAVAKNSVGSAQIKNNSVSTKDIKNGSVKGKDVKNNSLTGKDINEATLDVPGAVIASSDQGSGTLTPSQVDVATVTLTAPADGVVHVNMQAEFDAQETGTFIYGELAVDGVYTTYIEMDPGDTDGFYDQRQSAFVVLPVSAGTHTYTLSLEENGVTSAFSNYVQAAVSVIYAPSGVTGSFDDRRAVRSNR